MVRPGEGAAEPREAPRHANVRSGGRATKQGKKKKTARVMKKEVASSSTTPSSSVSVAAASDGEHPPLLVPVADGAKEFLYERGGELIYPQPRELIQVR